MGVKSDVWPALIQFIRYFPQFIQQIRQSIQEQGRSRGRPEDFWYLIMIPLHTIRPLLSTVDTYRPRFFFKREWRWHVLMMPLLVVLANTYLIGPLYFTNVLAFAAGTTLAFGLYWACVVLLTLAVRWSIRHHPGMQQTVLRTLVMLNSVGILTVALVIVSVGIYSLVPATSVYFSWALVRPLWIAGLVADAFLCITLGLSYTYSQWQVELQEDEQWKRQALQRQYDALKGQLNPHFLFNALSSLSVLIGEEPRQAEQFVDKMARVYRYMLQSGRLTHQERDGGESATHAQTELVTVQAELEFINLYADLLRVRYGNSLCIHQPAPISSAYLMRTLLPLSLLTLVDNAVKHNTMSAGKPLMITIEITSDGWLQVTNNRQPKTIRLETIRSSLASLVTRYDLLRQETVGVETPDGYFKVRLPLLSG